VRIEYGDVRPIVGAVVQLNNFDYRHGDSVTKDSGFTRISTPFVADFGNRRVTFRHRPDRDQVQPLLRASILRTASLVEIAFDARPLESEAELLAFAADVSALCTIAAGAGVGVAVLTLLDR